MKDVLSKCWGFRSGVPWKKLLAVVYYAACLGFLIIGMTTPPMVEAVHLHPVFVDALPCDFPV